MATSFNEQFGQYGAWRREFALRLKLLSAWMKEHALLDAAVQDRLRRLEDQMRSDKVSVAFVAEFSRGKSELINALFFATYGRRIMPAGAGRTTMCPTELGFDPALPASLRLLPITSRLDTRSLMDWRLAPEEWTEVALDVHDPAQLAGALTKVTEVRRVPIDEARALGFWHDDLPDDNPIADAAGQVEVPRWRHALVNIAHPLLQQGLVILDTPGLNAVGAEPELTINLIAQAHAVVFILAADAGVTRSDMAVWREHLSGEATHDNARVVVLNKIDTLWDALSTPEQIAREIDRQRAASAAILGLPAERVMAVSAQKGLLAKISADDALLQASGLPALEQLLGQGILGERQNILRATVSRGIAELRLETGRVIQMRRRELSEQKIELQGLGGKNTAVIKNMRQRIEQEKLEFDIGNAKIHAVRSVQHKLLGEVFGLLGSRALKAEMMALATALQRPGLKLGMKGIYAETFTRLRGNLDRARAHSLEIQSMLAATFRQLNAEYGFSLQAPAEPDVMRFDKELQQIEQGHLRYLGLGHALRMAQPEFADRLVRALATRLRAVYEAAFAEVELWSKTAAGQLEAQLQERRTSFGRRIEAIDRIQQAAGGLDERVAEIESQEAVLGQLETRLQLLTSYFVSTGVALQDQAAPEASP
ncbi:dynamin family protein [Rhodoferax koreense]|uniref:Dynamin family protein n=1 Tax=Rhodoferax koreensis TaxID=1842727 RepID=A0A1P8K020_9BURK|nr:dynamin family protein [Rhodoferax koreense]APW39358.1 dynamin family protein [Rhodoferax koreense]